MDLYFYQELLVMLFWDFHLGINALSLLFVAGVAAYVRVVTVRMTLLNDWISFIPALLFANFIYFISLYYFKLFN